ncbi:MAG: hypothetical protein R6W90_10230 [Ignavibacteriaceae bacterium]
MFLNVSYADLNLLENQENFRLLWYAGFFFFFFFIFCGGSFAQWVNNPSLNTRLVVDAVAPVNISSVEDLKGGAFIVWEENNATFQDEVFFLHVDGNGKVSFRADGKKISNNFGAKSNPVAAFNTPNTAVVVYKDFTYRESGDLFIQKVLNNGNLLWGESGVRLTATDNELSAYSASSDMNGNVYVSYLSRSVNLDKEFQLSMQKIDPSGKIIFNTGGVTVYSSDNSITQPDIVTDENGGAVLFWLENRDNKSVIYAQRIDSTGKGTWGTKPMNISGIAKSVISFSAKATDYGSIYVAWQLQNTDKDIYHQLISTSGNIMWNAGGLLATDQKGDQVNPQVLTEDSTIILSWTNEIDNDRNVFIQKYNQQGNTFWGNEGFPVINLNGAQFGQKLISDGKGGAIVAWIDRRVDSVRGNIYAQRITSAGKTAWNESAIPVAFSDNTEKSYLSVVSDKRGGAIFIFRDKRDGKGEIYGQKIFNTGTYVSQIIGFSAETRNDSVKISWYSANEMGETQYDIERTTQSDSSSTAWELIGTVYSDGESAANFFEYYDKPDVAGTIYYRVIQSDDKGNFQPSDVARLNYIGETSEMVVAQNSPNPFSDETVIEFYLTEDSHVSVEFFNSRIEEVKKIEEVFPAGKNELKFAADGLQPGIYFYRFKAGNFVDVKKMVITNK